MFSFNTYAARIKDLANMTGVRTNHLTGYGLVVGLDGTGDQVTQTPYTNQALQSMLIQSGVSLSTDNISKMQSKNTAAVMVSTILPPFTKNGQTLDIVVSSIGNAKSLKGGVLIMTPLKGVDGQVYAIGQGSVITSNIKTGQASGLINNGAVVEKEVQFNHDFKKGVSFELKRTDYSVIQRIKDVTDREFGIGLFTVIDGRQFLISVPEGIDPYVFMAKIENHEIPRVDPIAKITIHSKTGAIVMNRDVEVFECAVSHNGINLVVGEDKPVAHVASFPKSTKLGDVIKGFNSLGVNAQDIISIIQAMHTAGALNAELEIL